MNTTLNLHETSHHLLSLNPDLDYTDDELDMQDELAVELIRQYGWPAVCQEWTHYLYNNCPAENDVIRFAHNFFDYASNRIVPDALRFIAYLYYRVDVTRNNDAYQIFDSLAITILSNAGLVDMIENPLYTAETDSRIQAEIATWVKTQHESESSAHPDNIDTSEVHP